jgi:hypothetical protein
MSNQTQKTPTTPEVIEATVVIETDPSIVTVTPKTPGKVKTALRHPIQTIKRHNVVTTAVIAATAGVVSTLLLVGRNTDEEGQVIENDAPEENIVDFPVTN